MGWDLQHLNNVYYNQAGSDDKGVYVANDESEFYTGRDLKVSGPTGKWGANHRGWLLDPGFQAGLHTPGLIPYRKRDSSGD